MLAVQVDDDDVEAVGVGVRQIGQPGLLADHLDRVARDRPARPVSDIPQDDIPVGHVVRGLHGGGEGKQCGEGNAQTGPRHHRRLSSISTSREKMVNDDRRVCWSAAWRSRFPRSAPLSADRKKRR